MHEPARSPKWWDEYYINNNMAWGDIPATFLEDILPLIPKNATVLDLGCGNGRNTVLFCKHGFTTTGLDFAQSAVETAKKRCNADIIRKDILTAESWINSSFDVVVDFGFYHFWPAEDRQRYFDNLDSILNKGGLYINESGRWRDPPIIGTIYTPPQLFKDDFTIFDKYEKLIFQEAILPPHGQFGEYPCYQMVYKK